MTRFGIADYGIFIGILVGCASFGIYQAFRGKKTEDYADEYLVGGRRMKTFPVAISLVVSSLSGITLLGAPTETYLNGTEYAVVVIPIFLTGFFGTFLFLPVFHETQHFSAHEYLEKRFDKGVRLLGSLMFIVSQICWLPLVIHVPAVAFSQVSGVNMHTSTPWVCLICIFYTYLGGLKAVVWIDATQTWIMVGSMIILCVKGSLDIGGFYEVWIRNHEGGRLVVPTFNPDFTQRHTFWGITVGGLMTWIQDSIINQNVLQRYLSLPDIKRARRALWIFVFGTSAVILMCCYAGLVIYASYHDCDPLTTKLAKTKDQLLPLFAMNVLGSFPGLPGLFVAGIFSASLSSLSTGLISMSAVILEDFIKLFYKKNISKRITSFIMRATVVVFGALLLAFVVIIENLDTILQLSISLGSATSGPILGIFISGMLLPWVNEKGALLGGLLGLLGSGFVIVGAQNAIGNKSMRYVSKSTSVEGCKYYYNSTVLAEASDTVGGNPTVFPLFKLSCFWYTAFGCLLTILLSLFISCLTGFSDFEKLDPICFSPVVRNRIKRTETQRLKCQEQKLLNKLKSSNAQ